MPDNLLTTMHEKNPGCLNKPQVFCSMSILIVVLIGCQPRPTSGGEGPVEPGNALSTFELEAGFKIELISSEPVVADPVDAKCQ